MEDLSNLSESGLDASKQSNSSSSGSSNRSLRVAENIRKKGSTEDRYQRSLKYLSEVQPGTVVRGNDALQRNLGAVEAVALSKGLSPDAVSIVLEFALSLRTGGSTCSQVLKFLIPATVVPQEAVVRGVSWLCVGKMPMSAQVLFVRWILTVFDLIDCKDHLRAIYGFIFSFITEENLCPYICHLLYLLTMREHVQPYRVRKLLEVQAKMGRQPYISQLLALYKVFRPELVTLSVPSKMKVGFKNHNSTWKKLLSAVQKKNMANPQADHSLSLSLTEKPTSRKRKLHHLQTPPLSAAFHSSSTNRKSCRLEQLSSFPQLLENIDSIELPAQMGALLGSSLGLHYLDCVRDESAFLRLNFWLGHALHEEFLFGSTDGGSESSAEASRFLSMILSTQHFLQEGFSSTERFLLKFLTVWDGSLHRPQILELLSDISPVPSSCIKTLLFDPLMQLYFTSSVFYKCSVIECLNSMLVKWLTWHAVCAPEEGLDISLNSTSAKSMSLSGFMDSVAELVRFVGRLATVGLQLENCHALLLNHALDFYETVCDMFLKYDLPLFIIPPAGVFYPALLATDSVTVDRLGFIMYRYRKNLTLAKTQQQQKKTFHISRSTYNDFNRHLVAMVSCLWNSKAFVPEMGLVVGEELLAECQVAERWSCFDLVHHPAFVSHAVEFHQKCWPERPAVDLNSIKAGKYWGWYLEFLFNQGLHGLREFAHINTNQRSSTLRNQCDERPLSQA